MDNELNISQDQNTENLKEISKWAQRYAENRTLPFLLGMLTNLFIFAAVGFPSYFGGKAYRSGNTLLLWICILSLIIVISLLIFCTVPKWGGKYDEKLNRWLYRKEGQVKLALPEKTKKHRLAGWIAGLVFGICVMISIFLIVFCGLPIKYMQPVSAIFVIPLIIAIGIWQPRSVNPAGFLVLLWPILYVIHAILIVAGVPIVFQGPWTPLNIIIPIIGYGILCALPGHFYSRYALKS
ncbi:MAG TPA: hypothetical protein HPP87_00760 [Planctomycetes bacterium]|nr:hypothetical protein [Planctomycetota bacterium]